MCRYFNLSYSASSVADNLRFGTASGADGSDTLVEIENIGGSAHGDTLTGDANANVQRSDPDSAAR